MNMDKFVVIIPIPFPASNAPNPFSVRRTTLGDWGALAYNVPDPLVGTRLGREYLLPIPFPLDNFVVSILAALAPQFLGPHQEIFLGPDSQTMS